MDLVDRKPDAVYLHGREEGEERHLHLTEDLHEMALMQLCLHAVPEETGGVELLEDFTDGPCDFAAHLPSLEDGRGREASGGEDAGEEGEVFEIVFLELLL